MKKLPGFQSLKYLLLAIQTAICTLFSSGNCQTKQEADSIMEFIQNNFYSQGEKSKESLATLYRISREQGDYDLLAEGFSPSRRRSGLRRGVARNRMRTEAGKMPECLIFLIRNGLGVSNDRFGFIGMP